MRKFILLSVLLITISSYAQVFKTVNLTTAGTLSTFFNDYEKTTVTNLTLTGNIDASDFQFMRSNLSLVDLNISGTTIMAYTGIHGTDQRNLYSIVSYRANEIPYRIAGSFQTITLPKNITSIGDYAFEESQIKTISIPNTVLSIGYGAFFQSGLSGVFTVPNTVRTINDSAFKSCFGLTSVIFENSNPLTYNTTIGANAFSQCNNLKILYLSNSVISIGDNAFYGCISLQTIYSFNPTPPTLESNTFGSGTVKDVFVTSNIAVNNYKTWYLVSWSTFFPGNIIKVNPISDSPSIQNYHINVYSNQLSIVIEGTSVGEIVKIYLLSGICLQTIKSQGQRLDIQENRKAVYLVEISNKIFKIVI
jgi:hypothetical protein